MNNHYTVSTVFISFVMNWIVSYLSQASKKHIVVLTPINYKCDLIGVKKKKKSLYIIISRWSQDYCGLLLSTTLSLEKGMNWTQRQRNRERQSACEDGVMLQVSIAGKLLESRNEAVNRFVLKPLANASLKTL